MASQCCPNPACANQSQVWEERFCDFADGDEEDGIEENDEDTLVCYKVCTACGEVISVGNVEENEISCTKSVGQGGDNRVSPTQEQDRVHRDEDLDQESIHFTHLSDQETENEQISTIENESENSLSVSKVEVGGGDVDKMDAPSGERYDDLPQADVRPKALHHNGKEAPAPASGQKEPLNSIESLRTAIFQQPCRNCGNRDERKFKEVKVDDGAIVVRTCQCGEVSGLDDTMDFDELVEFVRSADQIRVASCSVCGNEDAEQFVFEETDDQVALVCRKCSKRKVLEWNENNDEDIASQKDKAPDVKLSTPPEKSAVNGDKEKAEAQMTFSCQCGNDKPQNFDAYYDEDGVPVDIECAKCGNCMPLIQRQSPERNNSHSQATEGDEKAEGEDKQNQNDSSTDGHETPNPKSKRKTKGPLKKALEAGIFVMGFNNTEECTQYYTRYGFRCVLNSAAKRAVDFGIQNLGALGALDPDTVLPAVGAAVDPALQGAGSQLVAAIGSGTGVAIAGKTAVVDGISMFRDISQANLRRQTGQTNREGFIRLVVRRTTQSMGLVAGATVGHLLLPLVGIGGLAGITLGTFIGRGVGSMVGDRIGRELAAPSSPQVDQNLGGIKEENEEEEQEKEDKEKQEEKGEGNKDNCDKEKSKEMTKEE